MVIVGLSMLECLAVKFFQPFAAFVVLGDPALCGHWSSTQLQLCEIKVSITICG